MKVRVVAMIVIAGVIGLDACGSRESTEQRHRDANSPAGKAGQVAHKAAVQAGKTAHAIGQQLGKAAHDAHAGWKEAARKDQAKDTK